MLKAILLSGAISGLLAAGGAAYFTYEYMSGQEAKLKLGYAAAQTQAVKDALNTRIAQDHISQKIAVADAEREGELKAKTVEIVRNVPVYITKEIDRAFPLPCGWIRLHDSAASGLAPSEVSLPAGKSDADACPITASFAATIIVENYGKYDILAARYMDLRQWVIDEERATNRDALNGKPADVDGLGTALGLTHVESNLVALGDVHVAE